MRDLRRLEPNWRSAAHRWSTQPARGRPSVTSSTTAFSVYIFGSTRCAEQVLRVAESQHDRGPLGIDDVAAATWLPGDHRATTWQEQALGRRPLSGAFWACSSASRSCCRSWAPNPSGSRAARCGRVERRVARPGHSAGRPRHLRAVRGEPVTSLRPAGRRPDTSCREHDHRGAERLPGRRSPTRVRCR